MTYADWLALWIAIEKLKGQVVWEDIGIWYALELAQMQAAMHMRGVR